jgi:hypothetical protein
MKITFSKSPVPGFKIVNWSGQLERRWAFTIYVFKLQVMAFSNRAYHK